MHRAGLMVFVPERQWQSNVDRLCFSCAQFFFIGLPSDKCSTVMTGHWKSDTASHVDEQFHLHIRPFSASNRPIHFTAFANCNALYFFCTNNLQPQAYIRQYDESYIISAHTSAI